MMRWNQRQEDTADEQRMRGDIEELQRRLRESGESIEGLASENSRLEHSLADAMEQIAAIQGTNAVHMARVAELEGLFEDWRDTAQQQSQRAEKAEARVAELVDLVEELYPLIGTQYDVPELRERVRTQTEGSRASDIVAPQKPRPMSDAPRDWTTIRIVTDVKWCTDSNAWIDACTHTVEIGDTTEWLPIAAPQGCSHGAFGNGCLICGMDKPK